MGPAIGDILPSAIGVALSPVPIIAVILMLGTPKARSNGPAFAVGWIAGLVIVSVIVLLVAGDADEADAGSSTAVDVVKLARRPVPPAGAEAVAVATEAGRRGRDAEVDGGHRLVHARSSPSLLGAALSGLNPKNLALTLAAAASIAQAGLDGRDRRVAIAVFVVIGSLTVAGPVLAFLFASRQGRRRRSPPIKEFMSAHNAVIMMVVLLVLGAKLIGNGIGGLTD